MENNYIQYIIGFLVIISLILSFSISSSMNSIQVDIDENAIASAVSNAVVIPTADEIASKVVPLIVIPEVKTSNGSGIQEVVIGDKTYYLTKSEYEGEMEDEMAEKLALEELNSRDFKKAVFKALKEFNGRKKIFANSIESYRDITDIKLIDSEVNGNEVTMDVKVYYFVDGDEDETEKARLVEFAITIDDLDYDDDFEDTEVDESYLESIVIKKVY